jgi:predicted transcriptional regulator of viral defense system
VHKVIHRRLDRGAIRHRLNAGRLHLVHRGVYAVGHRRLARHGRWIAAVLACGHEAVLSHRSAAALWRLAASRGSRVEVTAASRGRVRRAGIELHQVRQFHPEDRSEREGIPVTSVARTLLDFAEVVDPRRLERAFEEADRLQLLNLREIERTCGRNPGRRGLKPLRALLSEAQPVLETRSELERRFLSFCRDAQLPPPAVNVIVAGYEVDALWVDRRLVVELDGYAFHRTAEEPAAVVETVRRLLTRPPAGNAAGRSAR